MCHFNDLVEAFVQNVRISPVIGLTCLQRGNLARYLLLPWLYVFHCNRIGKVCINEFLLVALQLFDSLGCVFGSPRVVTEFLVELFVRQLATNFHILF